MAEGDERINSRWEGISATVDSLYSHEPRVKQDSY